MIDGTFYDNDDLTNLSVLVEQQRKDGEDWARKKAAYYRAKALRAADLRAAGCPVGYIDQTIKGDEKVNAAMLEMDLAEVVYRASQEAIMARKLQVRVKNSVSQADYYGG